MTTREGATLASTTAQGRTAARTPGSERAAGTSQGDTPLSRLQFEGIGPHGPRHSEGQGSGWAPRLARTELDGPDSPGMRSSPNSDTTRGRGAASRSGCVACKKPVYGDRETRRRRGQPGSPERTPLDAKQPSHNKAEGSGEEPCQGEPSGRGPTRAARRSRPLEIASQPPASSSLAAPRRTAGPGAARVPGRRATPGSSTMQPQAGTPPQPRACTPARSAAGGSHPLRHRTAPRTRASSPARSPAAGRRPPRHQTTAMPLHGHRQRRLHLLLHRQLEPHLPLPLHQHRHRHRHLHLRHQATTPARGLAARRHPQR